MEKLKELRERVGLLSSSFDADCREVGIIAASVKAAFDEAQRKVDTAESRIPQLEETIAEMETKIKSAADRLNSLVANGDAETTRQKESFTAIVAKENASLDARYKFIKDKEAALTEKEKEVNRAGLLAADMKEKADKATADAAKTMTNSIAMDAMSRRVADESKVLSMRAEAALKKAKEDIDNAAKAQTEIAEATAKTVAWNGAIEAKVGALKVAQSVLDSEIEKVAELRLGVDADADKVSARGILLDEKEKQLAVKEKNLWDKEINLDDYKKRLDAVAARLEKK